MEREYQFDYYYGAEPEQFSFYCIPKLLVKDDKFKHLSSDAKLLYGMMRDRMQLSKKNDWIDENNRVFIYYTIENIVEDMNCSMGTAVKILAELDGKKGIGLIEKKRQGLGKPDMIYVKNFVSVLEIEVQREEFQENSEENSRNLKNELQEVQKLELQKSKICTSGSSKNGLQEVQNLEPNNTEINNTENSQSISINLSERSGKEKDLLAETYKEIISENIKYDEKMEQLPSPEAGRYQEMYELICDVVCGEFEELEINNTRYTQQHVKAKFLKLTDKHLMYVMDSYLNVSTKVRYKYKYLLTSLFNAVSTMNNSVQLDASFVAHHDFMGGSQENTTSGQNVQK